MKYLLVGLMILSGCGADDKLFDKPLVIYSPMPLVAGTPHATPAVTPVATPSASVSPDPEPTPTPTPTPSVAANCNWSCPDVSPDYAPCDMTPVNYPGAPYPPVCHCQGTAYDAPGARSPIMFTASCI